MSLPERGPTDSHRKSLTSAEAAGRLTVYGPNRLTPRRRVTFLGIFFEEVREPMIVLLLLTGVLYALWGQPGDALTIFAVIVALVTAEVANEFRAKRAVDALAEYSTPTAIAIRDGAEQNVGVETLVPGDVVVLRSGMLVPADATLLEAYSVAADESPLTGESVPAEKSQGEAIFAGTTLRRGHGIARIDATGAATRIGRLALAAATLRQPRTPLQLAMRSLSGWLVWYAIGFSVAVPLLGWLVAGEPVKTMILTGLSLAFAAIPEELPIIITMVLGVGAYRLARRHAIVKRLRAVETLGAVTTIVTDKTGTLTENQQTFRSADPAESERAVLTIGVLCNDVEDDSLPGQDPLDAALIRAARERGIDPALVRRSMPLQAECSFDNARKRMSTVHARDGRLYVAVKGAPGAVIERCVLAEDARRRLTARAEELAARGLRVVAFAERWTERACPLREDEVETGLTLVGFASFDDPLRPEAHDAIAICRRAGIRTLMVTGDHTLTAVAVAKAAGLDGSAQALTGGEIDAMDDAHLAAALHRATIVARTTPQQKLRIVQGLQREGQRVAVTGDGTNDAPALAAADIGVAMGASGTDVARDAADLVLADNDFATIVAAVGEGRVLYENLRKGVRYYLACKVALVLSVLVPVLLRIPVPFAPIQIILMELFMDLAASAAFVAEPAESDVMRRPPRDVRRPFMDRPMLAGVGSGALGLAAAVIAAYLAAWLSGVGLAAAQTIAFITWLAGHVMLAVNMRTQRQPVLRVGVLSNRVMLLWAAATAAFILAFASIPAFAQHLRTTPLSLWWWLACLALAFVGTCWMEPAKLFRQRWFAS